MSIRERQLSRAEAQLIDRELRSGRKPLMDQIQQEVARQFQERPAGRPRFQAVRLQRNTPSDPVVFNQMLHAIKEDLTVSTEEAFALGRRMMAMAHYYETEKQRISRELCRLSGRIESLLERAQQKALKESLYDSFTDFTQVSFTADAARNLPETTAFVNLETGEVTLDLSGHGNQLVDLSEAEVYTSINGTYRENRIEGYPENALNDHINESWRQVVTCSEMGTVKLKLTVTLEEAHEANALIVIPQMPKAPDEVTLMISADGETWKRVPITSSGQALVWVFESQPVTSFLVEFTKSAPDFINGTAYDYHFGAQRISLRSSAYAEKGRLVSKPLPLTKPARKVSLTVDQVIPPRTRLRYYVAEERGKEPLRWQEIRPGESLALADSEEIELFLGGSVKKHKTIGGKDLYSIGEIPEEFDPTSLKVWAGESMWLWEYISDVVGEGHIPSMADFLDESALVEPTYVPTTKFKLQVDAGFNRYTLNIWLPEPLEESFRLTKEDAEATVYLNNEEIRPSGDVYRYRFRAGWNQIVIHAAALGTGYITPRIAFADPAVLLFAEASPMRRVEVEDLVYNPTAQGMNCYAVDGSHLIVGYDPAAVGGVSYLVKCQQPVANPAEALRFMVVMERDAGAEGVTPRLRSYRLHVQ